MTVIPELHPILPAWLLEGPLSAQVLAYVSRLERGRYAAEHNDLLELLDDRVRNKAMVITSQLPVTAWHEWPSDPTLADAILDHIVHAAHKIALKGESMPKKQVE
jgi:hypothetical protein